MYTVHQYYKVKRENDALKYHYNRLVDILNKSNNSKEETTPKYACGCSCYNSSKENSSNVVEMLKKQNALLNRTLMEKNKYIMSLKKSKYTYLSSPRSPSSIHVDQFSEISELSS
jgi:predicted RNase H-like nuclease (RuvC/YqgF family)